jgi:hypothetical protein
MVVTSESKVDSEFHAVLLLRGFLSDQSGLPAFDDDEVNLQRLAGPPHTAEQPRTHKDKEQLGLNA